MLSAGENAKQLNVEDTQNGTGIQENTLAIPVNIHLLNDSVILLLFPQT